MANTITHDQMIQNILITTLGQQQLTMIKQQADIALLQTQLEQAQQATADNNIPEDDVSNKEE